MTHPDSLPVMVLADRNGNIKEFSELEMTGMSNGQFYRPVLEDLIPLPQGSELFALPGRLPVGWDSITDEPALLAENPFAQGEEVQAVAAFMAPAHTAIFTSSYQTRRDAPTLPLFAYTAVGWHRDRFWVAAFRSDADKKAGCGPVPPAGNRPLYTKKLKTYKDNRLIQHLGKCCLAYGCPAARNYFLDRWEAPLPTSPTCNARCLGCISLQPSGCCPATQDRISFVPTENEISQLAVPHLQSAEHPIVSFGQGCEGEPLLQTRTIEDSIRRIRSKTSRGTINLNSNASLPESVERLARAGLDSMRVSLNSAQEIYYNRYYRPHHYKFADVTRSINVMKQGGRFVSLNYFILPGFTDSEPEFTALLDLVATHKPDFIQLRNLNMDPEWYLRCLNFDEDAKPLGIRRWFELLKSEFSTLKFGYFNPPVRQ